MNYNYKILFIILFGTIFLYKTLYSQNTIVIPSHNLINNNNNSNNYNEAIENKEKNILYSQNRYSTTTKAPDENFVDVALERARLVENLRKRIMSFYSFGTLTNAMKSMDGNHNLNQGKGFGLMERWKAQYGNKPSLIHHSEDLKNVTTPPGLIKVRTIEGIQFREPLLHRQLGNTMDSLPLLSLQKHIEEFGKVRIQSQTEKSLYREKLSQNPSLAYVYNSFKNSTVFSELNRFTIPEMHELDKVLGVWILCDCERDNQVKLDIGELVNVLLKVSKENSVPNAAAPNHEKIEFRNRIENSIKENSIDNDESIDDKIENENNENSEHINLFSTLSKITPFGIQWMYIHNSEAQFFHLPDKYQLTSFPAFVLDNVPVSGIGNEKYVFHDPESNIQGINEHTTVEDILNFVEKFHQKKLDMVINSEEPHSFPRSGEIWHVVGSNFKQIVLNGKTDVLLLLYSPYNNFCMQIMEIFQSIAKTLAKVDQIIIAAMDHIKNDIPVPNISVKSVPTIYYFPKGDASTRIDIMDFLKKNPHTHIDYEGIIEFIKYSSTFTLPSNLELKEEKDIQQKHVIILDQSNFDKIVMDTTKDIIVVIHAPWCPFCITYYPIIEQFANELSMDKNILVASLDASKYSNLADSYHEGYPTTLLFTRSNKIHPEKLVGKRTIQALRQWSREYRDTPSNVLSQSFVHEHYNGDKLRWYKHHDDSYFQRESINASHKWVEYRKNIVLGEYIEDEYNPLTNIALMHQPEKNLYIKLTPRTASWSVDKENWSLFERGRYHGLNSEEYKEE